jgi:hypothetical protein
VTASLRTLARRARETWAATGPRFPLVATSWLVRREYLVTVRAIDGSGPVPRLPEVRWGRIEDPAQLRNGGRSCIYALRLPESSPTARPGSGVPWVLRFAGHDAETGAAMARAFPRPYGYGRLSQRCLDDQESRESPLELADALDSLLRRRLAGVAKSLPDSSRARGDGASSTPAKPPAFGPCSILAGFFPPRPLTPTGAVSGSFSFVCPNRHC